MRLLFTAVAFCFVVSAFSQEMPVFEKKPFKDSDGNLFWPLSLPVYLQLSTSPNSTEAITLTEGKEANHPMKWDGHGKHYIKHDDGKNLKGGESTVAFPVNVDGIAPVSSLELLGAPRHASATTYFGKGLMIFAKGKDEMSGLQGAYLSINQAPFTSLLSPFALTDEKDYHVQYFAVDKVGNVEPLKTASFTIDLTPPTSRHEVNGSHLEGKILSPRSSISISVKDAASGVKKTEYYLDEQKPALYSGKIPLASLTDGEHTLTYYSSDNVGNTEVPQKFTFYLDSKGPEVTSSFDANFAVSEGRSYASSSTLVSLEASDNKAGVKQLFYSINGAAEQIYTAPFALPAKQGTYSVRYRAIDQLDNVGATFTNTQISAIYIDDKPPVVTHSVGTPKVFTRDTLFVTNKTVFTLKSFDAESGSAIIDYKIDDGEEITYENPFEVTTEGKHSLSYVGTDLVNNSAVKTAFFVVDNTAPEIFVHTSLEKIGTQKMVAKEQEIPVYASGTSFYMAATDKSVGTKAIYYTLNKQAEVLYTQPLKLVTKGVHTLKIRAVDYLGNVRNMDAIEFVVQ
ncbi:OmpL47-type beta-barrel domain-containing protein [Chryseosolibacter indicus]|uniref:Ig-like domain-containing protein n=1 Tax=Chryseosolibacter indicus TaxID=2782351 RepID=A0ABS5VR77_9BACT|nr:hypothetical protein [Chryseosolibacter indicus]MBT1703937.1 hypothetical protein [Chryseosolibacter indicus]